MSLGDKMLNGILWSAVERITIQVIQFIIGLLLARILTPNEYGIIGIIMVFIAIAHVFIDSGFGTALVQKRNRTEQDISTVFLFNILVSIICYLIIWLIAPLIADFYEVPILKNLLRVLGISLILDSLFAIPSTLLIINLNFRALAKINFVAILFSGICAIYLAYLGYGVWALVFQGLINSCVSLVLMWYHTKWKPIFVFSFNSFKTLFSFGSKLLISSLLNRVTNDLSSLFIGKYLSTKDLGYYTRGIQFADFLSSTISSILDRVLLPGLTSVQEDILLLTKHIKQILKFTAFLTIPSFLGLLVLAEPIVKVLLTDKWLMAVPILQIFCLARLITILSGININLLYIIGRSDLVLKQQYIKIIIRIAALVISIKYGIIYIAIGELISTSIHYFINAYYPGKIMGYGVFNQLKDIFKIFIGSLIMATLVYLSLFFITQDILKITLGPIVGTIIYYIMVKILKIPELDQLHVKIRNLRK